MHEQKMVAELVCLIAVMGHHDREALVITQDLCHFQPQTFLQEMIHGGKGFIQKQGLRAVGHDAGERDALLLTAGQF